MVPTRTRQQHLVLSCSSQVFLLGVGGGVRGALVAAGVFGAGACSMGTDCFLLSRLRFDAVGASIEGASVCTASCIAWVLMARGGSAACVDPATMVGIG